MPTEEKDQAAWEIEEWCPEAKISPGMYYKQKREGRGPHTTKIGRRTIITEVTPRLPCTARPRRRRSDGDRVMMTGTKAKDLSRGDELRMHVIAKSCPCKTSAAE